MQEIWGAWRLSPPLATPMFHKAVGIKQNDTFGRKKLALNKTNKSLS